GAAGDHEAHATHLKRESPDELG
ncbi:MAG: hypothetical protein QOD02_5219, partial [Mycobacterium sp.]|nr:hypothetical protein [Mycobacterium sp.]